MPNNSNSDSGKSTNPFEGFSFYEEGKVPQYHKYHAEVSYMDELERIWGKNGEHKVLAAYVK